MDTFFIVLIITGADTAWENPAHCVCWNIYSGWWMNCSDRAERVKKRTPETGALLN